MFITNKIKLKNVVKFPENIGKWLILNKIPILSYSEKGEYIFANTIQLKKQLKLLPDELKGDAEW